MNRCHICGKEIPEGTLHLIYAFVNTYIPDLPAMELCKDHTDEFIEFVRRAKE